MSLWATGRCVRARQRARLSHKRGNDSIPIVWTQRFTTASSLQINVKKGANRPANKPRRKKDLAKLKEARARTDWDDDDYSALEESVGGPEVEEEGDGPKITKIAMKKPRPLPYSQFTRPRDGERVEDELRLPPFMRPEKQSTRFDKWYKTGTYAFGEHDTQKEKESKAPFATAFAQNPWAQMLATPLRHDSYTGARLPKACLLDFHLADDLDNDRTKLLPLGLAAAMLPKTRRWNKEQKEIYETNKQESAVKPEGAASYAIAKKEALEYIDAQPAARMRKRVIGVRMTNVLSRDQINSKLDWNANMADLVLKATRKIVRKRMKGMMQLKEVANNEGVIAALPNRYGLHSLDDVENVGCVVRLRPQDTNEPPEPHRIPEPKTPERSQFWPNLTSFLGDTYGEWDYESPAKRWAREEAERLERGEPPDGESRSQSSTRHLVLEHWSKADLRGSPFLGHCLPLPAPSIPATWYFPTIRYRTQRIPMYNLPYLLGDKEMERLLDGTVFGNVNVVTVTQPWVSNQLQSWLFKLQMFVATTKDETEKA